MAEINKINIGGVEYDIAGSGSSTTIVTKTGEVDDNNNPIITEAFTEEEFNTLYNDEYSILRLVIHDEGSGNNILILPKLQSIDTGNIQVIVFTQTAAAPGSTLDAAIGINVTVVKQLDSSITCEVTQMDIPVTNITANPTLSGSETNLTSIAINGTNYKIPSGGSGSGSAGSLIIEKQAETLDDGHIRIQFTQNELDQLKNDPNAIVRTHLLSLNVDFKQLLPSANSALVTSLKFYTELSNGVFVLTASEDDPLIYSSSKVSGHLFGSGSLIIEKEFNEDGESITLTEDEYLQLVSDPNAVIKVSEEGLEIFFKQLLPIAIAEVATQSFTRGLKFYSEMLMTNGDTTMRTYGVLSEGDNPLTYVLNTQFNLFDNGSPYAYDIGTVSIGYESYGVLDGKTGTLSEENYNKLYWTANPVPSILQENKIYLYTAAITNPDGYDIARFSLVKTGSANNTWACTLPHGLYILTINSDKTWSIAKQKIAFDDS